MSSTAATPQSPLQSSVDPAIAAERAARNRARKPLQVPRAPTPWMNITNPNTQIAYRVRLIVKRRQGALHLQFAPGDASYPGKEFFMRASRPGYYEFIRAGQALLRASMWDVKCQPGVRAVWNVNAMEYGQRYENALTVATFLERIVSPVKGRPARDVIALSEQAAARGLGGMRSGYASARAKRRNELLTTTQRITNMLLDLTEAVESAHRFMGYARVERVQLLQLLGGIRVANEALRQSVFTDNLGLRSQPPAGRRMTDLTDAAREEMTHDFDDLQDMLKEMMPVAAPLRYPVFLLPDEMEDDEYHRTGVPPQSALERSDEARMALWDELNTRLGRPLGTTEGRVR